MAASKITSLFLLLATAVAFSGRAAKLDVTMPKRGEHIRYLDSGFPMERWQQKSKAESACWFVRDNAKTWHLDPDCERQELRELVIHHVFAPAARSADWKDVVEWLSELEEERLYEPEFANPNASTPNLFGLPVHSGHIVEGSGETFAGYHHLIFADGTVKTILVPYRKVGETYYVDMVAWHAASWKHNIKSVSIAIVDHLKRKDPTPQAIHALNWLVEYYNARVPGIKVWSHREAAGCNAQGAWKTVCPGLPWFGPWAKTLSPKNRPSEDEIPKCK